MKSTIDYQFLEKLRRKVLEQLGVGFFVILEADSDGDPLRSGRFLKKILHCVLTFWRRESERGRWRRGEHGGGRRGSVNRE